MPFARAASVLAQSALGTEAAYTPPGAEARTVRVVLTRDEAPIGGLAMGGTGWRAMLPVSEVPARPEPGATLLIGEREYSIEAIEADEAEAAWMVTLRKVGQWQ